MALNFHCYIILLLVSLVIVIYGDRCDTFNTFYKDNNNTNRSVTLKELEYSSFLIPENLFLTDRSSAQSICESANLELLVINNTNQFYAILSDIFFDERIGDSITLFAKVTVRTVPQMNFTLYDNETIELYRTILIETHGVPVPKNASCAVMMYEDNKIIFINNCTIVFAIPICAHPKGSDCYRRSAYNQIKEIQEQNQFIRSYSGQLSEGSRRTYPIYEEGADVYEYIRHVLSTETPTPLPERMTNVTTTKQTYFEVNTETPLDSASRHWTLRPRTSQSTTELNTTPPETTANGVTTTDVTSQEESTETTLESAIEEWTVATPTPQSTIEFNFTPQADRTTKFSATTTNPTSESTTAGKPLDIAIHDTNVTTEISNTLKSPSVFNVTTIDPTSEGSRDTNISLIVGLLLALVLIVVVTAPTLYYYKKKKNKHPGTKSGDGETGSGGIPLTKVRTPECTTGRNAEIEEDGGLAEIPPLPQEDPQIIQVEAEIHPPHRLDVGDPDDQGQNEAAGENNIAIPVPQVNLQPEVVTEVVPAPPPNPEPAIVEQPQQDHEHPYCRCFVWLRRVCGLEIITH